jgi:squalene-hopene/tetraprenyl-beta-curcumene cyclase
MARHNNFPRLRHVPARPPAKLALRSAVPLLAIALWIGAGGLGTAQAADKPAKDPGGADPQKLDKIVRTGADFLAKAQAEDGSYSRPTGIGVTALATTALLRSGRTPADPTVAKGLKFLEGFVQSDGGIYDPKVGIQNYETSLVIVCLAEANADHRYDKIIKNADTYLKRIQWGGEDQATEKSDRNYGGAGYGKRKRPDLSNTNFLVDALIKAGNKPDDEAVKRALVFVSRCQNFESEHNSTPFAAKNPDGGFFYTCAGDGDSVAGKTDNGGLRSYASMTYAGLKSMIYAGLGPDDPRVKAATTWISKNYDLKTNPGLGGEGLYYYYHVFAKALATMGLPQIEDAQGVKHDWKRELVDELAKRQRPNGSWLNPTSRWLESDPNLVTCYALLALAYCKP